MMHAARRIAFGSGTILALTAFTDPISAAETSSADQRFEVSSVKMVRQRLVETIAALEKKDILGAKEAFEAYELGLEWYRSIHQRPQHGDL